MKNINDIKYSTKIKSNTKKLTKVLIITLVAMLSLIGCKNTGTEGNKNTQDGTSNEATNETTNQDQATTTDTSNSSDTASQLVVSVGNMNTYLDEVMIYMEPVRYQYEMSYGPEIWSMDFGGYSFEDMAKESIIDQIAYIKINNIKANERNITLTDEEIKEIETLADEYVTSLEGSDISIDKDLLINIYRENFIAKKVYDEEVVDVDTNVSDEEAKQITVQHLLVKTTDYDEAGQLIDLPKKEQTAALEKAEDLLEQAKKTDDFKALAEENTEDSSVEYTFGLGRMDEAFEKSAFALKTGELSGLVKTAYGYHIIYCVSDFDSDATESQKNTIIESRKEEIFTPIFEQWKEEWPAIINNEVWDGVKFSTSTDEVNDEDIEATTAEE